MGLTGFYLSNFVVSFIADIVLNDLTNPKLKPYPLQNKIQSLKPYFENKLITLSGIYAALTITVSLIPVSLTTNYFFKMKYPNNFKNLLTFSIISFIYGYIIVILIDEFKLFGNTLDLYYSEVGRGLWGAIAFLFSIIISFILNIYLIPLL